VGTAPGSSVAFASGPGGAPIAWSSAGEGPPLVMVPGWLSNVSELWSHPAAASALRKLSAGHRFVWYDRLGCGQSDRSATSLSVEDDVDQLVAVLDAAGIDRCDLIGYSFGGPGAALFASRHPDRVRHLVLYSTYARGSTLADPATFQAMVDLVRSGWNLAARTMAAVFMPDGTAQDHRWFSAFQLRSTTPEVAADLLEYMYGHDVVDVLRGLRVPTTVVSAQDDRVITPDHAREIAALVPGARLVLVEGRAHEPFIRDTGDVVEAVLAAIEGRAQQAPAPAPAPAALSPRETDVLRLLAGGASNKDIAAALGISVATVERHLTSCYRKIGVNGRAGAAVHAVANGIAAPG